MARVTVQGEEKKWIASGYGAESKRRKNPTNHKPKGIKAKAVIRCKSQ